MQRYSKNLPPDYYVKHFDSFIKYIRNECLHLISLDQKFFLDKISDLQTDDKKFFIRLINRSGHIFSLRKISYDEIKNPNKSAKFLLEQNLIKEIDFFSFDKFVDSLTKNELLRYLKLPLPTTRLLQAKTKPEVLEAAKQTLKFQHIEDLDNYFSIDRQILNYFIFLYYGRYETNLNIQTLSDLGLRSKNKFKADHSVRFKDIEEAQLTYTLKKLRKVDLIERPANLKCQEVIDLIEKSSLTDENKLDLDKLILSVLKSNQISMGAHKKISWLSMGFSSEIFKKLLNETYKIERNKANNLAVVELDKPRSLDHLLVAENFLDLKFSGAKRSIKTKKLLSSETIVIDSKSNPEKALKNYFTKLNYKAYRSENFLWTSLFGILFWDELFSSSNTVFHSDFDLLPESLIKNTFYQQSQIKIESKIDLLKDFKKVKHLILETICSNYGFKNGVFKWHLSTAELLINFLKASTNADPGRILRNMAMNFSDNKSGYPDLYYIKNNKVIFVEVKAEGDVISDKQFRQIRVLNEARFEAKFIRTVWQPSVQKTFVVIDVETTGGSANKSRVTEIGAVKIKGGVEIGRFQSLINPEALIPKNITRLTGITNQMVSAAPRFCEIAEEFKEFCGNSIFVAHNVNFDYSFIQSEFKRVGLFYRAEKLCTCAEMRRKKKGLTSYGLKNLSNYFDIELKNHHRALDDALAASHLLKIILADK